MERKPMEEEQVFEREAIFGRDTSSVFPTEGKTQAASTDAMKEMFGARRFISESEVEELKKQQSGTSDGAAEHSGKSLAEILAERKAQKEADFKEQWKLMKQGKHKPLDEEETQWLDANLQMEHAKELQVSAEETQSLETYRQAIREAQQRQAEQIASHAAVPKPAAAPPVVKAPKAAVKPVVKAVVRPRATPESKDHETAGSRDDTNNPVTKRTKLETEGLQAVDRPAVPLAGLLGDYGGSSGEDN